MIRAEILNDWAAGSKRIIESPNVSQRKSQNPMLYKTFLVIIFWQNNSIYI
jgi:hypothetical protein